MTNIRPGYLADEVTLLSRVLLVALFSIFGWSKLTDYSGTVGYMAQTGVPLPGLAALVAIAVEFFVSIALLIGIGTRPLALLMAVYTLATAFLAHHYWSMTGAVQYDNEIHFYKNVSIVGGFLLLYAAGPGKYALDAKLSHILRSAGAGRKPV